MMLTTISEWKFKSPEAERWSILSGNGTLFSRGHMEWSKSDECLIDVDSVDCNPGLPFKVFVWPEEYRCCIVSFLALWRIDGRA